jgi:hypothetical protein
VRFLLSPVLVAKAVAGFKSQGRLGRYHDSAIAAAFAILWWTAK